VVEDWSVLDKNQGSGMIQGLKMLLLVSSVPFFSFMYLCSRVHVA